MHFPELTSLRQHCKQSLDAELSQPLPTDAIIAGGICSRAIIAQRHWIDLAQLGTMTEPDIDIFSKTIMPPLNNLSWEKETTEDSRLALAIQYNLYKKVDGGNITPLFDDGLPRLLGSSIPQRGRTRMRVNWSQVSNQSTPDAPLNSLELVNSFDLNCSKVGIELSSGRQIVHPEFEDFIRTGTIKATAVTTPGRTLLRLHKYLAAFQSSAPRFHPKIDPTSIAWLFIAQVLNSEDLPPDYYVPEKLRDAVPAQESKPVTRYPLIYTPAEMRHYMYRDDIVEHGKGYAFPLVPTEETRRAAKSIINQYGLTSKTPTTEINGLFQSVCTPSVSNAIEF